jgi:hypothetical protein
VEGIVGKLSEEQQLAESFKNWRKGNPDKEGRTLSECAGFFKLEPVRMLTLVGVEISKVRPSYLNLSH